MPCPLGASYGSMRRLVAGLGGLFSYDAGITSQNLGDVQRLPGGNLLVDFSNADVVRQVGSDGTLLVEINGAGGQNKFGYATWRPSLYGPSPDITD